MGLLNDFWVSVSKNWGFNYEDDRIEKDVKHTPAQFDEKELRFKVEPYYYDCEYFIMKYSYDGSQWYKVTRAMDNTPYRPERTFPHLGEGHSLVEQAKEFKQDPSKFKAFNDKQDERYNTMLSAWNAKQDSYKNRKTYII